MKTLRKLLLSTAAIILSVSVVSPALAIKTEGLPPRGPTEKAPKAPVEKAPVERAAKVLVERAPVERAPARELKMADLKPAKPVEVQPRFVEPVRKELPFKAEVTPSGGVKADKVVGDFGVKAEGLKDAKPGESGGVLSVTYPLGN